MKRSLLTKIAYFIARRNSDSFIRYLRKKGVKIGDGTFIKAPRHILIDLTRPSLLTIGDHVFLHKDMSILTHDWTGWCFIEMYNDFVPSHKETVIGNNVWFGEGVKVLSGVHIGDNCIIGAYSVVTRDIPSNSVAVGIPCKPVHTIQDYYERRKNLLIPELIEYANSIKKRFGRELLKEDFYDDYPAFVDGSNFKEYNYPYNVVFNEGQFEYWKQYHKAPFNGFDDFLRFINEQHT